MSDFTLADGRELTFNLDEMNYGQWLGMFDPKESDERSDKTLARVVGLTSKELKSLSFLEYKKVFAAFLKKTREPLTDPNA